MKYWTESSAMEYLGFTIGSPNNNFGMHSGVIYAKNGYQPTETEMEAVWYLCSEWDYSYEEYP